MNNFEEGVVTVAENTIVELHDCSAPKITLPIFFLVSAYIGKNFVEKVCELFSWFPGLGSVLCQIFEDGPDVEQRSPVDVAEICQE